MTDPFNGALLICEDLDARRLELSAGWNGHDAGPLAEAARLTDQSADILEQMWPVTLRPDLREPCIVNRRREAALNRERARLLSTGHGACPACAPERIAKFRAAHDAWLESVDALNVAVGI